MSQAKREYRARKTAKLPRAINPTQTNRGLTLISGPPCAGKTRYATEHAERGDLILDSDALYAALSGLPLHHRPESLRPIVWQAFFAALHAATDEPFNGAVWVIHSAPEASRRAQYRRRNRAQVVVLETPADTCAARATQRYGEDTAELATYLDAIADWWRRYERDERDQHIATLK